MSGPFLWLGLVLCGGVTLPAKAQTDLGPTAGEDAITVSRPALRDADTIAGSGMVRGVVTDATEAAIPQARVEFTSDSSGAKQVAEAAEDGSFVLPVVVPGVYHVTVARDGFKVWHGSAQVGLGEQVTLPTITMVASSIGSTVEVRASAHEVAEAQMELQEKQRVLGVFPNFYASYAPHAEPLSAGQKFRLAWRFVNDPVALAIAGVTAGSEQRAGTFAQYGYGAQGYARRYGAAYGDGFSSTFLGEALLPAVFHQDPRYFVKGTGSVSSRVLYAMASMVICKGDNGRWQPNYSNVLGNFASAELSNVYYPAASRGASLVVANASMATMMGAVGGLFQEFLLHRMTPHVPDYGSVQ